MLLSTRRLLSTFSAPLKALHKSNAHRAALASAEPTRYDYIRTEVASRLVDRLEDVRDRDFPVALDLGAHCNHIHEHLAAEDSLSGNGGGIGGVRRLVTIEGCEEIVTGTDPVQEERVQTYRVPGISEHSMPLPFPDETFDLVISSMALHWTSDLPTTFNEINRVLKPDGAFFLAMAGGATLPELRSAVLLAEEERDGGVSVHVGPFVDVSSMGMLLGNSGFKLPTIDVDTVTVTYPNMFTLCEHLSGMGESNASVNRRSAGGGAGMSRDG